ncbi:activator of HSP90 ATPase [Anopheles sinensis]|uniref:Activator of HSP90 ATPase n=1 Tax=Anopheles sinensis TaxID=74873 RepID=A0A084WDF3_ANOSI|nr:activator of HSP90 ATPase [Anopheles sinensis]
MPVNLNLSRLVCRQLHTDAVAERLRPHDNKYQKICLRFEERAKITQNLANSARWQIAQQIVHPMAFRDSAGGNRSLKWTWKKIALKDVGSPSPNRRHGSKAHPKKRLFLLAVIACSNVSWEENSSPEAHESERSDCGVRFVCLPHPPSSDGPILVRWRADEESRTVPEIGLDVKHCETIMFQQVAVRFGRAEVSSFEFLKNATIMTAPLDSRSKQPFAQPKTDRSIVTCGCGTSPPGAQNRPVTRAEDCYRVFRAVPPPAAASAERQKKQPCVSEVLELDEDECRNKTDKQERKKKTKHNHEG